MVLFLGVIGLAAVVLWLYCVVDVITTPGQDVRTLPKMGWIPVVVLFLIFGAIAWLLVGRPREDAVGSARLAHPSAGGQTAIGPRREPHRHDPPRGPDDDPEFLRRLDGRGDDSEGDDRADPEP